MKRTDWFPAPNDLSADSYVELVSHENGAAHLGAWIALLMVASRAKPRGWLVCADGRPHTPESLARLTRLPEAFVRTAIERLLAIGLLETGEDKPRKNSRLGPHPTAGIPQDPARKPQEGAVEGKGIEHHHQEGNFKEKNAKRTEPQGTERDDRDLGPQASAGASGGGFSHIRVDDDPPQPSSTPRPRTS